MQHDQTHAVQHAVFDLGHNIVAHIAMGHMAPPNHHIGVGQHVVGQTVLRLIQRGGANLQVCIRTQTLSDRLVHPVWVYIGHFFVRLFVSVFVPNGHANWVSHSSTNSSADCHNRRLSNRQRQVDSCRCVGIRRWRWGRNRTSAGLRESINDHPGSSNKPKLNRTGAGVDQHRPVVAVIT